VPPAGVGVGAVAATPTLPTSCCSEGHGSKQEQQVVLVVSIMVAAES
jgi:hypothetical protein